MIRFSHSTAASQMHVTPKSVFDYVVIGSAAAYLFLSFTEAWDNPRASLVAAVVLGVNGIVALFGLKIALARSYLLFVVFFVFNLLFLAVAPLQQIGNDFDPVFTDLSLVVLASFLSTFMTIVGLCFVIYRPFRAPEPRYNRFLDRSLAAEPNPNYVLLAVASAVVSLGLIGYLGSSLLQVNREAFGSVVGESKMINILVTAFFRPFTLVAPVIAGSVALARRNMGWATCFAILLLVGLFINNPLISARFRSSTLIVFCVLVLFDPRSVRLFLVTYFAGLLASPIFGSIFRYANVTLDQRPFSQFFVHPDFSGLDLFCYAIMWVDMKGLEYGSNIIGALLFFVPRDLWAGKGRTVGEIMHDYIFILKGFGTDNVSAPPPVEGYFSFGIVGAMLMSCAIVYVLDRVERRGLSAQKLSPLYFILCLSPMLCMILLRGPFQVGWSEWAIHSSTVVASAVLLLVTKRAVYARRAPPARHGITPEASLE
ncbi:hypothetical protein [Bradyrhizobium sp. LB11.1]|uniref:hypothetical protein n=1 Tax=Bradyrhizobium sp. LB11.1 TaxID=3156326 RepID=UPI00339B349E